MIVYVVLADCGLNGSWIEAVCSEREPAEAIARQVNERGRSRRPPDIGMRYTGFGGAEVVELVVDAPE